jgi:hypothetical protein
MLESVCTCLRNSGSSRRMTSNIDTVDIGSLVDAQQRHHDCGRSTHMVISRYDQFARSPLGAATDPFRRGRDRSGTMEVVHRVITVRLARKRRRVAFHKL